MVNETYESLTRKIETAKKAKDYGSARNFAGKLLSLAINYGDKKLIRKYDELEDEFTKKSLEEMFRGERYWVDRDKLKMACDMTWRKKSLRLYLATVLEKNRLYGNAGDIAKSAHEPERAFELYKRGGEYLSAARISRKANKPDEERELYEKAIDKFAKHSDTLPEAVSTAREAKRHDLELKYLRRQPNWRNWADKKEKEYIKKGLLE